MRIDLNADLGEGLDATHDRALMALLSSASIACGGHAGDEVTMQAAVADAAGLGLRIGAHPSYPDRDNFGRVSIWGQISGWALTDALIAQIESLASVARFNGAEVSYLKPHGALYNDAVTDPAVAELILDVCRAFALPLMMMPGVIDPGTWRVITEGFIDRGYTPDAKLMSRSLPGGVISDATAAADQALQLASSVDSLCVHSDSPGALGSLTAARSALVGAGYEIAA